MTFPVRPYSRFNPTLVRTIPSHPMGGATYELTDKGHALVTEMTRAGHGTPGIAKALGISPIAFRNMIRRDPEAERSLTEGLADLEFEVANTFLERFRAGDNVAGMFFAKTRLGWREGDAPDHIPAPAPAVQVNITIPEKMDPAEAMKIIGQVPEEEE